MIREVLRYENFVWQDVIQPDLAELESLAKLHGLHPVSLHDCLEPDHMPKLETFGNATFMIVRAFDHTASEDADTVREITRKIAIFLSGDFLLTIHRAPQQYIADVIQKWCLRPDTHPPQPGRLIVQDLLRCAILTFDKPLMLANEQLDRIEESLFKSDQPPVNMLLGYYLHRKGVIFKHLLKLSSDVVDEIKAEEGRDTPYLRDIRDHAGRLLFYATELEANASHLLNLALSVASQRLNVSSHRSNEIMRVLTVFSVFFLPLNFIAGVYGMNFENMPGLKSPFGYAVTLGVMLLVVAGVALGFSRKGWLHRDKSDKQLI